MESIRAALNTYAKPMIEADGGTIEVVALEDDVLEVRLGGTYGGCPGVPEVCARVLEPLASQAAGRDIKVKLVRAPRRSKGS